jgi:hypothetical protein
MRKPLWRLISAKEYFSEFLARQAKAKAERAQARTVVKSSFLQRVRLFCSGLFQDIGQLREKFSVLRIERTKAQAEARSARLTALGEYKKTKAGLRLELLDRLGQKCSGMFRRIGELRGEFTEHSIDRSNAKIQRRSAEAEAKKIEAEARAAKWKKIFQAFGKQCRFTFKRWADYRKQRLARKIVHERAKTEKWREIDTSVTKFFTALRKELGELFDWVGETLNSRPKFFAPFVGKVVWAFCALLALLFLVVTFFGIATGNVWVWSIAPLGVFLSLATYPLITRKGFMVNIGRIAFAGITAVWAGSWLILVFA